MEWFAAGGATACHGMSRKQTKMTSRVTTPTASTTARQDNTRGKYRGKTLGNALGKYRSKTHGSVTVRHPYYGTMFPFDTLSPLWAHPFWHLSPIHRVQKLNQLSAAAAGDPPGILLPF